MTESTAQENPMFSTVAARPEIVPRLKHSFSLDRKWIPGAPPFVYSDHYNTRAWGLQRLHPFDACKFEKIVRLLEKRGICEEAQLYEPRPITEVELLEVHTETYIQKLKTSGLYLCQIVELPLCFLPHFILKRVFTTSSFYHAAGTILSMELALEHGWGINIGGGMHHARFDHGEGWCFFADVTLGIKAIREETENRVSKFLYIDTDVHQGNGVERDKLHFNDQDLFILDVYNRNIWPHDFGAREAIDVEVPLESGTGDNEYLARLKDALERTKKRFNPDMIIYNAGTDILVGDKLGLLLVTPQGVIERDEIIFQFALDTQTPITMLQSGGYTKLTHKVIADSITNLVSKFNLKSPPT